MDRDDSERASHSGALQRREFIKRTGAAGAATILAGAVLSAPVSAASPTVTAPPPVEIDLGAFIKLSEALTGVAPLNADHAKEYLKRWVDDANPIAGSAAERASALQNLLAVFADISAHSTDVRAAIKTRIMGDAAQRPVAEQVIYLWYISAFFNDKDMATNTGWKYDGPPEHYGRGLVWTLIGGHAPMTPGGPVGYWAHPPANIK